MLPLNTSFVHFFHESLELRMSAEEDVAAEMAVSGTIMSGVWSRSKMTWMMFAK
ncbi:hypothetical protein Bca4012_029719 [Brassica carinata]|uniref:Uncharacterized protein n=1 Tax=Brassica oleracea var. oleracea TaxID=109376 RepID=A0A0D3CFW5_BRAOL